MEGERVSLRLGEGEADTETERLLEGEPDGERLCTTEPLPAAESDAEADTETEGVLVMEGRWLREPLLGAVALGEAEAQGDALREGGAERDCDALVVPVREVDCERDTEGLGDTVREPAGEPDTAKLRDSDAVGEELLLTEGEALGEPVPAAPVREGGVEAVALPLRAGEGLLVFDGDTLPERERVAQPVLVAEAHPVRERVKLGDAEGGVLPLRLALAHCEAEREREGEPVPLAQPLPEGVAVPAVEALGEGVGEREAEAHALTEGEEDTEIEPLVVLVNWLVVGMALGERAAEGVSPAGEGVTERDSDTLGDVVTVALPGVRVSEGREDKEPEAEGQPEAEPEVVDVLVEEEVPDCEEVVVVEGVTEGVAEGVPDPERVPDPV